MNNIVDITLYATKPAAANAKRDKDQGECDGERRKARSRGTLLEFPRSAPGPLFAAALAAISVLSALAYGASCEQHVKVLWGVVLLSM